jgi:hypothetical protein
MRPLRTGAAVSAFASVAENRIAAAPAREDFNRERRVRVGISSQLRR